MSQATGEQEGVNGQSDPEHGASWRTTDSFRRPIDAIA